jgi:hypothetical protein
MPENRCQSCGMPLGEEYYGTNEDNTYSEDYCKYCFMKGKFTQPHLTCDEMIKESANHMIRELKMPHTEAIKLATLFIPTLKRWHD